VNWQQLQAIIWLRWRLTRNQFRRGGQVNAVLSIFAMVVLATAAIGAGVGGVVGGLFAGWKAPSLVLLIIWDAVVFVFLVFWFTGLMVEIQRSESIDLPKLLHLPVTLPQVFVFNYIASHFSPGMVVALPAMLGLCAGLIVGAGPVMVLLVPLVLGFVFMVTAWTYCVRGWLAALMVNKRRRRTVIVWVTIVFVALCQLPNLVFNSSLFRQQITSAQRANRKHAKGRAASNRQQGALELPESALQGHLVVPPGWIGYGAMRLKERNPWPTLGTTAASWLIGVLGLMQAYRMTIRFYQGADGRAERKPVQPRAPGRRGTLLVERRLPWLPDDAAALTLATFRSLTRTPELKMAFIMPVVMGAVLLSTRLTHFHRSASGLPESWRGFAATGVATIAAFSIAPMMSNIFGLDRNGFRALVLLPTRRHYILLAKNLSCAPFGALIAVVLLTAAKFVAQFSWENYLAGLLQAGSAFLMFSLVGNVLSALAPYRLATGTLQAKKPKAITILAVFAMLLVLPLIALPMAVPSLLQLVCSMFDWVPWLPVNLVATLGLLAVTGGLYALLLPFEGRLLARREQKILQEVTEEVE
jgi:ABC-2 type transport system permease protein